ncbi:NAD(P)-dependent alcohol dehydrogenase [Streptosporangiaceae bacterium NEAU-GS5]|nr:NAD(P)-dependent alcohol dehydrogenase [Streptosporangiaceae bacterium NEAU-GS5]
MKAIRYTRYGSPDVLELQDADIPEIGDNEVLVRVQAASVNPYDMHFMRGTPYVVRVGGGLRRPRVTALGQDMAGQVEAVGKAVTAFKPGDEVYGQSTGSFAEYVSVPQDKMIRIKPANLTFEQAAAVAVAGTTALQAVLDKARVKDGDRVLVNGASGGVGTFAVQIAKALGGVVTGVCSTRNVEMAGSIGADHVIDYTKDDFTRTGERYDVLIDVAGGRKVAELRRILAPKAVAVGVGGPDNGNWIGPLSGMAKLPLRSPFVSQRLIAMFTGQRPNDLAILSELMESGKVTPVIDRAYSLGDVPEAMRYLETGHARAKIVITI